jgi:hypothetical protein
MMSAYGDPKLLAELRDAFKKADKKLDKGKCCVRFRKLDDLPLDAIGRIVARVTPEKYILTSSDHPSLSSPALIRLGRPASE